MTNEGVDIVLDPRDPRRLTLAELAQVARLHPELVERFVECDLLTPVEQEGSQLLFDEAAILRVQVIQRLRQDLGVNLSGIAVILDLIERLRELQRELDWLRSRL
ncbi:MAG TPA: chaperone modulator CbpM [Alphaproteobacteria bacterium]|nr:chaperone modulator CbpM [Alphaproteobacteria bacterium]